MSTNTLINKLSNFYKDDAPAMLLTVIVFTALYTLTFAFQFELSDVETIIYSIGISILFIVFPRILNTTGLSYLFYKKFLKN